jgi:TonB-dependent receptor
MLGAIAVSPVASAQASDQDAKSAETLEEVVVTGMRRSLETSQEIKKNAEVFVDSITAEDIGALPDRSVTEALQRIPGVSISRFAAGNDPDHFSIEGSGVVVRGLPQVRSELNGRDTFSANSGRFLSFSDVPPELLGGVDVYKNQSADLIEGGLAGTVNLRTLVPFDREGQHFAASVEGNYGDFAEEMAPTGSVLWTNRWESGQRRDRFAAQRDLFGAQVALRWHPDLELQGTGARQSVRCRHACLRAGRRFLPLAEL